MVLLTGIGLHELQSDLVELPGQIRQDLALSMRFGEMLKDDLVRQIILESFTSSGIVQEMEGEEGIYFVPSVKALLGKLCDVYSNWGTRENLRIPLNLAVREYLDAEGARFKNGYLLADSKAAATDYVEQYYEKKALCLEAIFI